MLLQIGSKLSKYFDEKHYLFDSLHTVLRLQDVSFVDGMNQLLPVMKGSANEQMWKNYPKDKITTMQYLFDNYTYEEDIPDIKWQFLPGEKEILGYQCKKAKCNLFGREYEAWYAIGLPQSNGPWKLGGLPGLILEAKDQTGEISFTCVSISFPKEEIGIFMISSDRDAIKTTKKDFRKMKERYLENPGAVAEAFHASKSVSTPTSPSVSRKRLETFIELELE